MLACITGQEACVRALLGVGACVNAKWQYLRPIQWAAQHKHEAIVQLCAAYGGNADEAVPLGRGRHAVLTDATTNRLLPAPASTTARPRRRAGKALLGSVNAALSEHQLVHKWAGCCWANHTRQREASLLAQLIDERAVHGAGKGPLATRHPGLKQLEALLARYLELPARALLPADVVRTFAIHPGVRFANGGQAAADPGVAGGEAAGDGAITQSQRRTASPTILAGLFQNGEPTAGQPFAEHQQYAAIKHPPDTFYLEYFAALCLTFSCTHEGVRHELCLVRYLYPDMYHRMPQEALVPLLTEFVYTKRDLFEVLPISALRWRAPLFRPPRLHSRDEPHKFLLLCEDVYVFF